MAIIPFFKSNDKSFTLLKGDCVELLNQFDFKFDMIFADPPYFLSNDGISVQSGKMVSVNKGEWDRSNGFEKDNEFNLNWLKACKEHLTENGTIWISGTFHNIFSDLLRKAYALFAVFQELLTLRCFPLSFFSILFHWQFPLTEDS